MRAGEIAFKAGGRWRGVLAGGVVAVGATLLVATLCCLKGPADALPPHDERGARVEFSDRQGRTLAVSFQNRFNYAPPTRLGSMPKSLVDAFLLSEDQRFYDHSGVDWSARIHALWQAVRHRSLIRGARSITEQAVGILNPRPRTVWSRWLEGIEAVRLERQFSKQEILEFYLNQVPFGARRRGVVSAARYYFDRDLGTLNLREQLALVVAVRAPERLHPQRNPEGVSRRIDQLIVRMQTSGLLREDQVAQARTQKLDLQPERDPVEAGHFVQYVRDRYQAELGGGSGVVRTTLDSTLQLQIQKAMQALLRKFSSNQLQEAAALVVDHERGEILAWVNDRRYGDSRPGSKIDAVLARRQPGSTLKPFVYAEALERGWTAATIIDDRELYRAVGSGVHRYRNYSRTYHGQVRLREALGNSLNIPAVKAAEFVGRADLLDALRSFGLESLRKSADHYGEGLALGNGEVSLRELVSAYAVLARGGDRIMVQGIQGLQSPGRQRIISAETATIIADILADPQARMLEFGRGGVLQFPTMTAVKTGTSTGYRDLWAVGFSARFTAGVWMGNLDRKPTQGLTSSQAPAILLRSIFALLEQRWDGAALPRRGDLAVRTICAETGVAPEAEGQGACRQIDELFSRRSPETDVSGAAEKLPQILVPSPGLVLARDPRTADRFEKLGLILDRYQNVASVRWYVDHRFVGEDTSPGKSVGWNLETGAHQVVARIRLTRRDGEEREVSLGPVPFFVK